MAKKGKGNSHKTIVEYRGPVSDFVVTWQSFFLLPFWGFVVLMPLGALARLFGPETELFVYLGSLSLFFLKFLSDLLSRRIEIDEKTIRKGMRSYPLSKLRRVYIPSANLADLSSIPIALDFYDGNRVSTLTLSLLNLTADDAEKLLETLARKVSGVEIASEVERSLRLSKEDKADYSPITGELFLPYEEKGFIRDLPNVLISAFQSWSKSAGPLGTVIVMTPLWLVLSLSAYTVLRDYTTFAGNQIFYTFLVAVINYFTAISQSISQALVSKDSSAITMMIPVWSIYSNLFIYLLHSAISPNRLTVNEQGISLDRFFELLSFQTDAVLWENVTSIKIKAGDKTADPSKWKLEIEATRILLPGTYKLSIALGSLNTKDRERLLIALQKFAPTQVIEAEVSETLTRENDRSYTELWLQSLSDGDVRKNLEPLSSQTKLQNGRYEICRRLGIGGEGTAYEAIKVDPLQDGNVERVVLKETIIPPYLDRAAERDTIERVKKECEILASLASPLIVSCHGFFIEDKRSYLILEYIDGDNLRTHTAKSGPSNEIDILRLAITMCDILAFLHDKAIIHRDFTPDNLIFCKDGTLKLIDFAVATEDKGGMTGTIVGKHAYIPPEQFRGYAQTTSDIYAFGATLYHLLTGKDPEPITTSSPIQEGIECSAFLDGLITRCTKQDQAKRPRSANEIKEEIEAYLTTLEESHVIKVPEVMLKEERKLKHA